jgi:hypothetical protein
MTIEQQRADILNMLRDHTINVNDALLMLKRLDEENTPAGEGLPVMFKPQNSFSTLVENIVDQVVSDMDMERIYQIMEDMDWKYVGGPATRDQILDCVKDNIRHTLRQLVHNYTNDNKEFAETGTGGFICQAWVDDDDWDNVQVELAFQPITGYGSGHLSELVEAKTREV